MPRRKPLQVVGLDPSLTSFGIAKANGETLRVTTTLRGAPRLQLLRTVVQGHCLAADLVVLEGYSLASKYQREALGELGGVIRVALLEAHVPFVVIAPSKLKKFATGRGNATKAEMKASAIKYLGLDSKASDDEADAVWLRQAGLHLLDPTLRTERSFVLDGVDLPKGLVA